MANCSDKLNSYAKLRFPDSKYDLYAMFIERSNQLMRENSLCGLITQHSWMFLSSYEKLRLKLSEICIINMAHIGAKDLMRLAVKLFKRPLLYFVKIGLHVDIRAFIRD